MKNKNEIKKIGISILAFIMISLGISYYTDEKINALEEERKESIPKEEDYLGDCYDENVDYSDDIIVKIIEKIDSSVDINFINKFDELDENNKTYSSVELSVSGDLEKIKEIECILNDLNLNYKMENLDIKNPKTEDGNAKSYVDCIMKFKVI